ncbi:MAG: YDG domain-containing protein [Steroidobacteraceae bacterium]
MPATTLPSGGSVVGGSATIIPGSTAAAAVLTVDQTSQRAVIDWNTFDVGSAAQVNFVQPDSSSATLNDVLSSTPSQIFGKITATGQVFLSNPNGVYFGKSATVDVGSLAATTMSISVADFLAGKTTLNRDGATGSVVNDGNLDAALGGYIALLAPEVRNNGVVIAHLGTVAMASGESVTLTLDGNHLAGITVTPSAIAALVENKGAVLAPGGLIILSAQAVDRLQGGVVNNSGTLEATGMSTKGGRIVLEASASALNSGTISANAGSDLSPAGSVAISAPAIVNSGIISAATPAVATVATAPSSARAKMSGGSILLNASTLVQTATGKLDASGVNGGSVTLIATQDITVAGSISAAAAEDTVGTAARDARASGAVASNGYGYGYGGAIAFTAGHDITLQSALLDASGGAGGGDIVIKGGGQSPSNPPADPPTLALLGDTELNTSSRRGKGGTLTLTADQVGLFDTSFLDAAGATGGGDVFVGGGFHGKNPSIANALETVVANAATIDASATQTGAGGQVAVWSDGQTSFAGAIAARGGATTGAGGFVEVSGKGNLQFLGTVDAGATHGTAGTLLLDPQNITIDSTGSVTVSPNPLTFGTTPGTDSVIAPSAITALTSAGTAVTLQANNDLTINSSIFTTGSATGGALTFQAGRSITVNATVTSDNGNITFSANDAGAVSAYRTAGTIANFTNNSTINAGTGIVSITMGTFNDLSGTIGSGNVNAGALIIAHNGPTAGAVSGAIDLGQSNILGNLTITANSARNVTNNSGSVSVTGTTSISVGTGNVTLVSAGTALNTVSLTAGSVILSNRSALAFGTTNLSGSLTATTVGPIGSTGSVQVAGAAAFTATGNSFGIADPYISLTNAANHFGGGLSLAVTSMGATNTGGYATVVDSGALNITSASVASNLTLQTGGALTQSGAITVPVQTTLTAGAANNITLNTAGNQFRTVQVVSGNTVTLSDSTAIEFGNELSSAPSVISGNLNVTAGGTISQVNSNYTSPYYVSSLAVSGTSTFAVTAATSDLLLGPVSNGGQTNNFAGALTLSATGAGTYRDIQIENISAGAGTIGGLGGSLRNVALTYINAASLTVPAMTLSGTLFVYTPNGSIGQSGPLVVAGATTLQALASPGQTILLNNAGNNFSSINVTSGQNVTIVDANSLNLYTYLDSTINSWRNFSVSGNLSVTALNGNITQTVLNNSIALFVNGTATFAAYNPTSPTNNISLNDVYDRWGTVGFPSAGNVTLNANSNVVLANSTISGALYVQGNTGSALSQVAGSTITAPAGTTSFINFANITLGSATEASNVFGNLAINQGNVTIRENAPITQASAWNIPGYSVNLTTSNEQAITLGQANSLGNITITQVNSGGPSAGAVLVTETNDNVNGMTQGGAWTTYGTTTLNSGSYSINLNNPNNVLGPLQVIATTGMTGSPTPVPSTVVIYAKNTATTNAITDVGSTGAWSTGADIVKLIAYDTTGTTAGGGNVILTNPGNVLGALYVKATNATITENASIVDGPQTSWDTAGDTGWVTTGTTNLIVANPAGKAITLTNLTNRLGPLSVSTTGTGTLNSVTITDNGALTQSSLWNVGTAPVTLNSVGNAINLSGFGNVMGAISLTGTPSSVAITENAPITQGNTWALLTSAPVALVAQGGNSITLTNASNTFGNLTVTGGVVSITENSDITQGGAWTTTGTTTLNPTAHLINLSNPANVLGGLAIAGTPSSVSIAENADITQASPWVQAATPFTLNAGTHNILLSQVTNQLGALTLTAQNATVIENNAAGITEGAAWTISGTTTLTAGNANPIVLTANPANSLGTLSIVSASNATINVLNGIIFGPSTIASGGTLTVSAGGAITQSGAISAPSLSIIGTGYATLTNPANNVGVIAAGFSGGALTFTDGSSFIVQPVGVASGGIVIGANNVTLTSVNGTVTGLTAVNAGSSSLTVTTGTALTLPLISIAGAQTYTASTVSGSGITLSAGISSSAAGAINFFSPVTLGTNLAVQSLNSPINFASTLTGGSSQLTVNAGNGTVGFGGAVTGLGSSGSNPALLLTSGGATFGSTLAANNGLTVTGAVTFDDNVTLANGNTGSTFSGLVTLAKSGGMTLSGYNGMIFNNGLLLQGGPETVNSNNGSLTFQTAGTISGPFGLTLNAGAGALTGLGEIGNSSNLTSLAVTAANPTIASAISIAGAQTYTATGSAITLGANVTSTAAGAINFASPVILSATATVTSSNSAVGFAGAVDGNSNLIVNSGAAATTFGGAVGAVTPLGGGTGVAITLQGIGPTTFSRTVQARSGITAAGAVFFNGNVTLANGGTGSTFSGLVTTGGSTGNSISGYNGITFGAGLTLTGGPISIASNGSTLSFLGTVSGPQNLTLNALAGGAGTITGLNQIGFNSNLTALNVTAQTLSLPSTGIAVAGPMTFNAVGGISVNGAVGNSSGPATGAITLNGPVTLATGAIAVTTNNADVTFTGTVNGSQTLAVNAGSGSTIFGGAVGGTTALSSLTTAGGGTTAINGGSVRTTGAQTYNEAVILGAADTLTGVNVTFNGIVNGANTLLINDGGTTTFAGVVGGSTALTSITTGAAGSIAVNTTAVTTSGAQTYNENMSLGANASLSSAQLTFGGTIDGAYGLNANAGSAALQFLGAIGASTPLASLTANGSTITLGNVTTTGAQSYTGPGIGAITASGNLVGVGIAFSKPLVVVPAVGTAMTTNAGTGTLAFNSGATFGANNMTLIGDQINIGAAVTGTGSLLLKPFTSSRNVAVGGSGVTFVGLNLTSASLASLPVGTLTSLTIGSPTGTGTLDVAGTFNAPLTPVTLNGGGGITQSGGSVAAQTLTLYASGNAINLANGANAFGAVGLNGAPSSVNLTNTLNINQLGTAAWNLGAAPLTLNAGASDIILTNAGNTFGTVTLTGRNASVIEAAATDLGVASLAGNLTLSSTGQVTQSGALAVGGNLTVITSVNAGDVTVNNSGAPASSIGNTLVGGNYTFTSTGAVTQAVGTSYVVRGNFTVTGSGAVLGNAGNLVGGTTTLPGGGTGNVLLSQAGVITLGLFTPGNTAYSGNLTVISQNAGLTFSSSQVSGSAILLNNAANNIGGSISTSASPPIVVVGPIVQTGINQAAGTSISVNGIANFIAQASSAGSLGIDLTNGGNTFGTLLLSGNTVAVQNTAIGLTTIGAASATTSLTLTTAGGVAQSGSIQTPILSISAAGSIMLNNIANDVSALAVSSAGNAISYVDANGFAVASLNAGGANVSLTAGGLGNLTQTGALLNVGVLSANAGGAVTLISAGNTIASLAASTAGSGLQVYDSNGVAVSGLVRTITGDLVLRAVGNLTLNAGGRLQADAGNVAASTEGSGNFLNYAGNMALIVGSGKRWLVYSNTPDLVGATHTLKGGLTSSFRAYGSTYATYAPGSVTQSGNGFIYSYATPTLTVTAAVVGTPSQVYGSAPSGHLTYIISGFVDSEDNASNVISGGMAAYSTALANTLNAGSYSILYSGGLTSSNVNLASSAVPVNYTVTPAVLTYNATPASRAYGAANPTLSGTITGFKLSDTNSVLAGTPTWTTTALSGSGIAPGSPVGSYAVNGGGYSLVSGTNYTFTQAAGNANAFTVGQAGLVVTANGVAKTYDGTLFIGGNGVTYSGFAGGENVSTLGGALIYGGTSQSARNVGSYLITPSGLSDSNYIITFVPGTLLIGKANLTLTTSNVTKIYNGTLAALGTAIASAGTPLFGTDTVSGGTFAFTNANAGSGNKTVTVSGETVNDGNGGGNYNVTYVSNTASTITPASLTVDTSNVTKTYDGTLAASGTTTLVSGTLFQNASNGNALDNLSGGSFAFTDPNAGVGNKTVTTSGVTVNDGNGGGNYVLTYLNNTTSTISQATLNFVGAITERAYDGTNLASLAGYSLTGLVGNQTVTATPGTATFADKNAGPAQVVTIGGITLANGTNGGLASNYFVSPTATATGIIDQKLLTVNATIANKVYDGTTLATLLGYGLTGFVGTETVNGVSSGGANFLDKNAGTDKAVTVTGISLQNGTNGGLASNYAVSNTASSEADITPAALHVAGLIALNTVYNGTLAADVNSQAGVLTGVIGSDNVQVGSITGSYLTKDVGSNKPITTSAFVLTGTDAEDYTLVQPTGLTANVTPRPLDVSATGINKVYDGTTAASVVLADNAVAGDQLTITSTDAFLDPNAGTAKYISVSNIVLSGANANDYSVNSTTAAYATVTPATLIVIASGVNEVYNGTTAATVTLTDRPVAGSVVDLTYATALFANKNVGNGKTVTVNGITASGADANDYTIDPVATTTANITPATLLVSASGQNKVYDGTTAATVGLSDNGIAGDQLNLAYSNAVFTYQNATIHDPVTVGGISVSGADAGNYTFNTTATTAADITPAVLTVSATGSSKPYDGTTAASVTLSDNALPGAQLSLAHDPAAFANPNAGNDKPITVSGIQILGGADAGNYVLADATVVTTGDITTDAAYIAVQSADGTWSRTPVPPQPLTIPAATPASSVLDLTLPTDFGGGTISHSADGAAGTNSNSGASSGTGASSNSDTSSNSGTSSGAGTSSNSDTSSGSGTNSGSGSGRASDTGNTSGTNGVNGSDTAGFVSGTGVGAGNTVDSDDLVTVSLLQSPIAQLPGMVSVSVPQQTVESGKAFSFPLPAALREAAVGKVRVKLKNGQGLPSWLRYGAPTKTFTATGMPGGALPIEVVATIGEQRWTLAITERASR